MAGARPTKARARHGQRCSVGVYWPFPLPGVGHPRRKRMKIALVAFPDLGPQQLPAGWLVGHDLRRSPQPIRSPNKVHCLAPNLCGLSRNRLRFDRPQKSHRLCPQSIGFIHFSPPAYASASWQPSTRKAREFEVNKSAPTSGNGRPTLAPPKCVGRHGQPKARCAGHARERRKHSYTARATRPLMGRSRSRSSIHTPTAW